MHYKTVFLAKTTKIKDVVPMEDLEFYEIKEEIEEEILKNNLGKLRYAKKDSKVIPYIETEMGIGITLERGKKDFKTTIFENGYESENPFFDKYKEKEYSKEEFINLVKEIKNKFYASPDVIEIDKCLGKALDLIGITLKKRKSWNIINPFSKNTEFKEYERLSSIYYGKEKNDIYRIECIEDIDVDTINMIIDFKRVSISKVEKVNKDDLIFTPKKDVKIYFVKEDRTPFILNNRYILLKEGKTVIQEISVSETEGITGTDDEVIKIFPKLDKNLRGFEKNFNVDRKLFEKFKNETNFETLNPKESFYKKSEIEKLIEEEIKSEERINFEKEEFILDKNDEFY